MAGTFIITGFTQYGHDYGPWDDILSGIEIDVPPDLASQGRVFVLLSGSEIFLDGSLTPTAYADLPEDFGIASITYKGSNNFFVDTADARALSNPLHDNSDINIFTGGIAQFYWTWEPLGLYNYQVPSAGLAEDNLLFFDPYTAGGVPPVPTKWNGGLLPFLENTTIRLTFKRTPNAIAGEFLNIIVIGAGQDLEPFWEIRGVYDSYPPPPNIIYTMAGGVDLGGFATIQVLSDASGIYTLVPGQFHDELYQRVGTTSTTISVMIPRPFFKTGYIGGK